MEKAFCCQAGVVKSMLPEATPKEKILANATEELGFGVSALGTGVPGPWWEMSPYKVWQGAQEIQRT